MLRVETEVMRGATDGGYARPQTAYGRPRLGARAVVERPPRGGWSTQRLPSDLSRRHDEAPKAVGSGSGLHSGRDVSRKTMRTRETAAVAPFHATERSETAPRLRLPSDSTYSCVHWRQGMVRRRRASCDQKMRVDGEESGFQGGAWLRHQSWMSRKEWPWAQKRP